ncbi:MAG: HAMP domain-containing histidine kinase [Anaerolineae bacterium]|nr:HAMP domain-containing histidine kinase [Anaerolineae bacterium]
MSDDAMPGDPYLSAIERLIRGELDLGAPGDLPDDALGSALRELAATLQQQRNEQRWLDRITVSINAGLLLDDVLSMVYADFRGMIPYDRIGLALLEDNGQTVRSRWAKSTRLPLLLRRGYEAPLAGSSLETILRTGQPRILNDLEAYLCHKPNSDSTRRIVEEGIRSSLTCPLVANGEPVGFLFFSSAEPHTYDEVHIERFQRIAAQLSVIVEKGRMVSELAGQKRAIERQNEELRRLDELKNTFLGIAAHDLRSPLSIIQMSVDFWLDPRISLSSNETDTILSDIQRQVQHMLVLLNDLLDVTQIEAGKLELNQTPINAMAFLSEAVERHARLASRKGTRVHLDPVPPGNMAADEYRLRQVIDNLISNAVKYAPAGSVVTVGAVPAGPGVGPGWRMYVQDKGPGILPEERAQLFQDFSRLSSRPTGDESSTGLGLAISRRIVEAHGGQIGVDSEPGAGATFWFTLPE